MKYADIARDLRVYSQQHDTAAIQPAQRKRRKKRDTQTGGDHLHDGLVLHDQMIAVQCDPPGIKNGFYAIPDTALRDCREERIPYKLHKPDTRSLSQDVRLWNHTNEPVAEQKRKREVGAPRGKRSYAEIRFARLDSLFDAVGLIFKDLHVHSRMLVHKRCDYGRQKVRRYGRRGGDDECAAVKRSIFPNLQDGAVEFSKHLPHATQEVCAFGR